MALIIDLVTRFGNRGASANAAKSLEQEREAALSIERFLLRFDHPAGQALVPVEALIGPQARVA